MYILLWTHPLTGSLKNVLLEITSSCKISVFKGKENNTIHITLIGSFLSLGEQWLIVLNSTREYLEANNILRLHLFCTSDSSNIKAKIIASKA